MLTDIAMSNLAIALLTFLAQIGAKWVYEDLDDDLEIFLSNKWMRKLYVFAIIFISTQNFNLALLITGIYWIVMYYFSKNDT
jgi:hypothetical protein